MIFFYDSRGQTATIYNEKKIPIIHIFTEEAWNRSQDIKKFIEDGFLYFLPVEKITVNDLKDFGMKKMDKYFECNGIYYFILHENKISEKNLPYIIKSCFPFSEKSILMKSGNF